MSSITLSFPLIWQRYLIGPRLFGATLIFVTIVPYFSFIYNNIMDGGQYLGHELKRFAHVVIVLGFLHVPTTIYLFFDPMIRRFARDNPWSMIVIPILFIIFLPAAILWLWDVHSAASLTTLIILLTLFVAWQAWHFGMQSYGVHCFVSMTSQRPKRDAFQMKCEKYCIMLGTISGMLAVYHAMSRTAFIKNLPLVDYAWIQNVSGMAFLFGKVICFSTLIFSIVYFVVYRRTFTLGSAAIFFAGVCFFLPDYVIPNTASKPAFTLNSASNFIAVHGIQYIVFLCVHAFCFSAQNIANAEEWHPRDISEIKKVIMTIVLALAPLAALALALHAGELFTDKNFNAYWLKSTLKWFDFNLGMQNLLVGFAIIQGLTAAHFVIDMQVWRLSRPSQREWIFKRYRPVLPIQLR